VLVFLHGGGFREGDPTLYGFLAEAYLQRGILFASVGYRLRPECYLPETCRDLEAALGWLHANIGGRGGDIHRLFVSSHSAGAMLTALVTLGEDRFAAQGLPANLVKGAVAISGLYDLSSGSEYVRGPSERLAASALHNVRRWPGHTIVAYGTRERPAFAEDGRRLADALRKAGASVELVRLEGLDHAQAVSAFGDESSPLFQATARMIARSYNAPGCAAGSA
jgi:arylformamidase